MSADRFPEWSTGRYNAPDQDFRPAVILYFENPIVMLLVGLFLTVLITRATSGHFSVSNVGEDGVASPPSVPYYLPLLGHIPNMAYNSDGFIKSLRDRFTDGIFTLNFFGGRHNIMYHPGLTTALLNQKHAFATSDDVTQRIMVNVFGFPKKELQEYERALADMQKCYSTLLTEPSLGNIVSATASKIKETIKDLVTNTDSEVDHMLWERTSNASHITTSNGGSFVEANLLELIRDYTAYTVNPVFMGSDFLGNFPNFFEDIWTLDRGFLPLATGLPRWFPFPLLTRAHIAQKRILESITTFHEAMEKYWNGDNPGSKWSSLDDVGALIKARMPVYQKYKFSMRARAAAEHSLLWASNANSDLLVFWMVVRIYHDRALLEMIREEIAPYVKITQRNSDLPIKEAPQMETLDTEGLCNNCPLLKSCYVECLRLDTASWSLKIVKQDFILQSREKDAQGWLLKKGDYAHVAHDLHNTDPRYFEGPEVWKADRHIRIEGEGSEKKAVVDMGSIRPYGGGLSMCKGRAFAFKESMMFTAAIVAMWDIDGPNGSKIQVPKHRKATGTYNTSDVTRVRVTPRRFETATRP